MRNVTIWQNQKAKVKSNIMVRLYHYKGHRNALNNFLYPKFVYRENDVFIRSRIEKDTKIFFPNEKGNVILMFYPDPTSLETGEDVDVSAFENMKNAITWLITAGYEFYGDESDRRPGVRKCVAIDRNSRMREYIDIAYPVRRVVDNSDLNEALTRLTPPKEPTPPSSRILNAMDAPIRHDSSIPVPRRDGQDPELPGILKYPPEIQTLSLWSRFKKLFGF